MWQRIHKAKFHFELNCVTVVKCLPTLVIAMKNDVSIGQEQVIVREGISNINVKTVTKKD